MASSPKLQELIKIRERQTLDVDERDEKLVVFSEFPIVVFIAQIVSMLASLRGRYTNGIIDHASSFSEGKD